MNNDVFVERLRNKSTEKIRDPAGIQTQDLLNTRQTLLLSDVERVRISWISAEAFRRCCLCLSSTSLPGDQVA